MRSHVNPDLSGRRGEAVGSSDRLARVVSVIENIFMDHIPREVAWLVSFVLVEAAVIDGRSLRVPNWLTFHFLVGRSDLCVLERGQRALAHVDGGRGRGSLDPLAAVLDRRDGGRRCEADGRLGAWIGPWLTLWAFVSSALAGAVIAAGDDRLLGRACTGIWR